MPTKMIGIIIFYLFSAAIILSQSLTARLDSIYNKNPEREIFLHSVLSLDSTDALKNEKSLEYNIIFIHSIAYFLLSDIYNEKPYKIQILEKGLDKLKRANKLSSESGHANSGTEELYDELFNIYYRYKTGDKIETGKIESLVIEYSSRQKNDEIINWFKNKLWRNKCSGN